MLFVYNLDLEVFIFPNTIYLETVCIFVLLSHTANYVIRWLLGKGSNQTLPETVLSSLIQKRNLIEEPKENYMNTIDSSTLRAGRTIGVLERWIWFSFILLGYPSLIGFVITAKSIVRFKELEDKQFAEYYLIGTLYSGLITLALSSLVPGLWR